MRLFGLVGYPLGHSFSASFFNKKFKEEGIDAEYRNFQLEHLEDFRNLLSGELIPEGLNVTVPYKQAVIPYLDELSATARAVQAVNTITFRRTGGRVRLLGDNTDVPGFRRSLEEHLTTRHRKALVLGTGGASKAVLYVLERLGISRTLVSRTRGDRQITYGEVDEELVRKTTLIVNTTPLGMLPEVATCPDIPYRALTGDHLLFDLVYNPEKTLFLAKGEQHGATIVNGYDMLIYQAEAAWEIWNTEQANQKP